MRKEFRSLLSLDDALSTVLSALPISDEEIVPLEMVLGRVLAEKVVSEVDVPGFDRASMDGYAVISKDTLDAREDRPAVLRFAGMVPMGALPSVEVASGQAVEVSTGSMIPGGADAVVMVEHSTVQNGSVLIYRPLHPGENIQTAGSDISLGEAVLFPGTRLASREIGVLAAVGRNELRVRRLKVGVVSTGYELVPPGGPLGSGQIYDINSYSISAAAKECGGTPVRYGVLPDEREAMAGVLKRMADECSMILVSGSTSAGAGDMVYRVLDEIGEMVFHGVNLKPGKPTLFGFIENKPCLGLPGYPTSALTVFMELAAPAIRKSLGLRSQSRRAEGRLARPVRSEGRRQLLAVSLSGNLVYPVDKGSGSITTLARADGVIEIPSDVEYLTAGENVEVRLFGEPSLPELVIAGENSFLLESLVERLSLEIRLLSTGAARGKIYLQDGIADLACVSCPEIPPMGFVLVKGFKRGLGLIYRDLVQNDWAKNDLVQNNLAQIDLAQKGLADKRIVGWHKDSEMKNLFESFLKDAGIAPSYVRLARTHSAVAAAVASGRADLGFGEKAAAKQYGLSFQPIFSENVCFLVNSNSSKLNHPAMKVFLAALQGISEAPGDSRNSGVSRTSQASGA